MSLNRNVFYSFIIQVPILVFNLVTSIFITRTIGADGRGIYALAQNDVQLFGLVLSFSLNGAIVYYVAKNIIDTRRLAGISLVFLFAGILLLLTFLAPLTWGGQDYFSYPEKDLRLFYAAYYAVSFFLNFFNTLTLAFFHGRSRFGAINGMALFTAILNFLVFFTAYLLHSKGLISLGAREVLMLGLGTLFLNTLGWLFLYLRHIRVPPSFRFGYREHVLPLFRFVIISHLSNLVNFISYRIDLYFVDHYDPGMTHEQAGYYSLAVNIGQMFWMISIPISTVLQPYLTAEDRPEKKKMFSFFSRVNIALVVAGFVPALLLAHLLFPLLYGAQFSHSVTAFYLLAPGIIATCMTKIFSTYVYSSGKVQYNLVATIAGAGLTIVLDLLLIPVYGIEGAAVASSCAYLAVLGCTLYFFYTQTGAGRGNYYLLTGEDIRTLKQKARSILAQLRNKKPG
ncbi:MAG: polysaccharide biosynthesis protein [Bacteroidetes bacterium]|nr:MAG: polysaccharide biosynthesis protein [Bacteroidota bacterium]